MNQQFGDAARLDEVRRLKKEGLSMSEIVARLSGEGGERKPTASNGKPELGLVPPATQRGGINVTLDDIHFPAYMVNHNFEMLWMNPFAQKVVFSFIDELPPTSDERNLFRLLPASRNEWISLLRFHVALAKARISAEAFANACRGLDPVSYARLQAAFVDATPEPVRPTLGAPVTLYSADNKMARYTGYASHFREGIFVVLVPESETPDIMLDLLARRDEVIRGLLRRRLPVLTPLAVLVADLQGSVKICSELPPSEYFELINEIWSEMAPLFRKHHGTCGKHVGDGLVYYFFPQADSDYLVNALICAQEIRNAMRRLSGDWQLRKNWLNELYLNVGITEGQEWFGTYQSSTGVEFVVLGDTINQAARVSELARFGGIWATKSVIGKIPAEYRDRVSYGVRRRAADGREVFVPSSFSQVQSLIEQDGGTRFDKQRDIATVPVTEITEVRVSD